MSGEPINTTLKETYSKVEKALYDKATRLGHENQDLRAANTSYSMENRDLKKEITELNHLIVKLVKML